MKRKLFITKCTALFMVAFFCAPITQVYAATSHPDDYNLLMSKRAEDILDYGGTPITYDEFDADYYAEQNPDVAESIGTDKDALYSHYVYTGYGENRKATIDRASLATEDTFDVATYLENNPDLKAIYYDETTNTYDIDGTIEEYQTTGLSEGRQGYFTTETAAAEDKVFDIINEIITDDMTDEEKIKAVHDWICINNAYGYVYDEDGNVLDDDSYHIPGPMLYGTSVCQGYAETFNYFMQILSIRGSVMHGTATNSAGDTGAHAWNTVLLGDTWYYLDVTWDDPVGNVNPGGIVCRYTYYLTTDGTFGGNHTVN